MTNPTPSLHADLELGAEERRLELEQARRLADRYRIEFVDMDTFRIDQDLFRSLPTDLMLRYAFVPYRREGNAWIAPRVEIHNDGKLVFFEDYTDIRTNVELSDDLFVPSKWRSAKHWVAP